MTSRLPLLEALRTQLLLCDGAMGTQLMALGLAPGASGMLLNVDWPEAVRSIHAAYRSAGCDLITTNSFGGTRTALDLHGAGNRVAELNHAAAALARAAAGPEAWVLGDVGPFGGFLEPLDEMEAEELEALFAEQIAALAGGGADALLIETMVDPAEVEVALRAAAIVAPSLPRIVTFAFQIAAPGQFRTIMGTSPEQAVCAAREAGAHVIGANCGTGLGFADYLALARELVAAAGAMPVILQPNAGAPRMEGERCHYDAGPAEFAAALADLRALGVRVVGGCCGTTPEHLAAAAATG